MQMACRLDCLMAMYLCSEGKHGELLLTFPKNIMKT